MAQTRNMEVYYEGIPLSAYGFYYVPDNKEWHRWQSEFKVSEKIVDSQDGGSRYGVSIQPKDFNIRCYFEDIPEHQLDAGLLLLHNKEAGQIRFGERDITYTVSAYKPADVTKYTSHSGLVSGLVTFYMRAYYPFGLMPSRYWDADEVYENPFIVAHTTILPEIELPPNPLNVRDILELPDLTPMTAQWTHYELNGGNAKADTIIRIAGDVGSGITIYNKTTKQTCRVVGLTETETNDKGPLTLDSRTGEVYLSWLDSDAIKWPGYRYHDRGFIQLAPSMPAFRDIKLEVLFSDIGMYQGNIAPRYPEVRTISYLDNGTRKWATCDGTTLKPLRTDGSDTLTIPDGIIAVTPVVLNELVITPDDTMSIKWFSVDYHHTFQ